MGWKGETTILGGINQTMGRDWERRANKIEKRRAWKRSNKVMNENLEKEFNYLIDGHKDYFSSKANYFEQGVIYWLKNLPNKKELDHMKELKNSSNIKPIFIVGVPRCGSTVIEKVIASGTKRFPIGEECSVISNIVGEKVLANNLLNTDTENLKNQIIKKYESLSLLKKESNYIFTDKTLDNFFFIQ